MALKNKKTIPLLLCICGLIILSGCATQPYPEVYGAPGFFVGLWHGFISPFALIGSIFMDIRIYEFPNSGGWYDFGFILGIFTRAGGAASR